MRFDSFSAFLFMEGHGPYVWTCYAVFVLGLAGVAFWSARQRTKVIRQQYAAMVRLEQRQKNAEHTTDNTTSKASDETTTAASFSRIHSS